MAAVELATAYLSLVPSAAGIKEAIRRELGDLDGVATTEGKKVADGFGSAFKAKAKDLMGGAGIAAGAALTAGFVNNLGIEKGTDKLSAQLGLSAADSARAGKLAGTLYTGAYGDSLDQVNEAIAGVSRNITGLATTSSADMQRITAKTLDVATAFDQDLGGTTAAVGQLIKTGLAANADEAFDIITRGFQGGVDKAGDFLDTITEYGTQFRKMGVDGATATGLLTQGLQAGARDADIVADAIKEFAIRAVDGSKLTGEGFTAIGLDATKMAADIAAGGPTAAAALDLTLDRLRGIKDPTAQSAAAVALFGTQAEDLGKALFALDPSTAVAGLGQVAGAADTMGKTLADNTGSKLDSFKRRFELATASIGGAVGPIGAALPAMGGLATTVGALDGVGGKIAGTLGSLASGAAGLGSSLASGASAAASFAAQQGVAAANAVKTTAALVAQKAASVAQTVATQAAAVAQGIFNAVMALNPVFLIVLAVGAFIAVLVLAYTKVEWFRDFVDAAFRLILGAVTGVVDWVRNNWPLLLAIITGPIGLAVLFITKNWDTIKAGFTAVKDWIGDRIGDIVGFITGIPGRIANVARTLFSPIIDAWKAVVNTIIDAWNSIDFGISIRVPDWVPGIGGRGFSVDDIFPDIPRFGDGGTVPGPVGAPRLILAHGGEEVLTTAQARSAGGDTWHVSTPATDPVTAARELADETDWRRKTGAR